MASDISDLWNLVNLREVYIANNQIGYIDSLSNLIELTVIDLSGNQINDISPILNLDNLKFVNLIGNPVPEAQISKLKEKGVLVMEGEV
ncbi:Internalin-A precursor [compost metagenome]